MTFKNQQQRRAAMARLSREQRNCLNEMLTSPDATVRTVKVKGKPYMERRVRRGSKIVIERVQLK